MRLLPLIVAAFAVLIPGVSAEAQTGQLNPTHYWTYHIDNVATRLDTVVVGDQFVPQARFEQLTLVRLLNPAWKTHGPIVHAPTDTVTHYDWWDVPNQPVPWRATISNQFDPSLSVTIYELDFLLTPTRKSLTQNTLPPITDKNHYLCYRAQGGYVGEGVILHDQFHEQSQLVASLTYFCNPCWKMHGGAYYPIRDNATHLALYRLEIPGFGPRYPYLTDQFVNNWYTGVRQIPDEYIVVPSEKHNATATRETTWGRIKSTYQ